MIFEYLHLSFKYLNEVNSINANIKIRINKIKSFDSDDIKVYLY